MNSKERGILYRGKSQTGTGGSTRVTSKNKILIHSDMNLELVDLMKNYYGVNTTKGVKSIPQLVKFIEDNPSLDTLVIFAHGAPGQLFIDGSNIDLKQLADRLSTKIPFQIDKIFLKDAMC